MLWKRVAVTFVEVSCVFGFCFWLTPITPTVLCVSTCSDGLLDFHIFGPRVRDDNRKSPHWACHRHLSRVGLFLLLVCQNRHHILSVWSGFFPCHKGIKGVFQTLLQVCRVYTLRGFISHHVGEPTQCWWATDTDVSSEAMGMQQTLCPW